MKGVDSEYLYFNIKKKPQEDSRLPRFLISNNFI
jgi:hypothetical protein